MERVKIFRKMAEKWSEVAAATTHPELRECYAARAAQFAQLADDAERQGGNGREEPAPDGS